MTRGGKGKLFILSVPLFTLFQRNKVEDAGARRPHLEPAIFNGSSLLSNKNGGGRKQRASSFKSGRTQNRGGVLSTAREITAAF